jgi:GNAT superfamily N-acetyltransferase
LENFLAPVADAAPPYQAFAMNVLIRRADVADAPTLTAIAIAAKRQWSYPDEWMALWTEALTITPASIAAHEVFVAELHGLTVGFYTLMVARNRWQLDHLYVRPSHMGRGIGRHLFEHATHRLRDLAPDATLFIEADPNAEPFYLRMGAKRIGEIVRGWQRLTRVLPELEFTPPSASEVPATTEHS